MIDHHQPTVKKIVHWPRFLAAILVMGLIAIWLLPGSRKVTADVPVVAAAATVVVDPVAEKPVPEPTLRWVDGVFKADDPIYNQLQNQGLTPASVHRLIDVLTPVYDFRKARPEHRWSLGFEDDQPVRFTLTVSPIEIYDVENLLAEPQVVQREVETLQEWSIVEGRIEDSLFRALSHEPQGHVLAMKLANVFAWDLDFYKDPRTGDSFDLLVEKEFILGEDGPVFHGYGQVLAARYFSSRETYTAFHYQRRDGKDGYYSNDGKSLIRNVLRSPLKFRRVSSSFQRRRFHPVLKKYRAHNGIDYAADRNTPVMAVADGRVVRAGRYGGAGIAVEIKHDGKILTQYFHLNGIAKSVRRGKWVRQGQVIGYVGKTGLATGYHLHFGMKKNGRYVNPQAQKFEPGKPVPGDEMRAFHQRKGAFLAYLAPETTEPIVRVQGLFDQQTLISL